MEKFEFAEWTRLEDHNLSRDRYDYDYSHAVHHSFGRGSFKSLAEKITVPKIVLDQIILGDGANGCWTECPRGHPGGRVRGGGAAAAGMGGVDTGLNLRPKSSGRARALHLRAEKALSLCQRRPGHHQVPPPHTSSGATSRGRRTATYVDGGTATSVDGGTSSVVENVSVGGVCYYGDTSDKDAGESVSHSRTTSEFHVEDDAVCDQSTEFFDSEEEQLGPHIPTAEDLSVEVLPREPIAEVVIDDDGGDRECPLDCNTLYFSNLPDSITIKELEQHIESFGKISHCKLIKNHSGEGCTKTHACVRMDKKSSCEWVISCFHGNPFERSVEKLICRYALES